jgi:hypothetical protein
MGFSIINSVTFRRFRAERVVPLLLLGSAWACVPEFSDETSRVKEPRILAVRAEPAEVRPGGSVTLRALFVNEDGEEEGGESLEWALCVARKPLTEVGPVAPECVTEFGSESEALKVLGEGPTVSASLASDVCRQFGPLSPPTAPGETVPGRAVDPDSTGGYYQPVVVGNPEPVAGRIRALCGPGNLPQVESVRFNQGYRPNENPEPEEIAVLVDGNEEPVEGTIVVAPGDELTIVVHFPACPTKPVCGDGLCTANENSTTCAEDCGRDAVGCLGAEAYLYGDPVTRAAVLKQESVEIGWFAAKGTFELATTDNAEDPEVVSNTWIAPDEELETTLWLVARDDRGGTSWRSVRVRVEE